MIIQKFHNCNAYVESNLSIDTESLDSEENPLNADSDPPIKKILENVDIDLYKKRLLVVGPSGIGKTSIVRNLVNIFSERSKSSIASENPSLKNNQLKTSPNFIVLPQNSSHSLILPDASWYEQLIYPKIPAETYRSIEDYENAKKIIDFLGFGSIFSKEHDFLRKRDSWNKYSGGEKQRILLARVLYQKPEYVVFDESFSNLDGEWKKKFFGRLVEQDIYYLTIGHDEELSRYHDEIVPVSK